MLPLKNADYSYFHAINIPTCPSQKRYKKGGTYNLQSLQTTFAFKKHFFHLELSNFIQLLLLIIQLNTILSLAFKYSIYNQNAYKSILNNKFDVTLDCDPTINRTTLLPLYLAFQQSTECTTVLLIF